MTNTTANGLLHSLRAFIAGLRDLLHGLFPLSTTDAPPGCDYGATIEARYSRPRRCC